MLRLIAASIFLSLIQCAQAAAPDLTQCPQTNSQWLQWRDQVINYLLTATYPTKNPTLLNREKVIEKSAKIYQFLEGCKKQIDADDKTRSALVNIYEFTKAQHWMSLTNGAGAHTNALGYDISDRDFYEANKQYVEFPELIRSQAFLRAMNSPTTYAEAYAMIEEYNKNQPVGRKLIALPFRAQFIKTPDNITYGRFLIYAPNIPFKDGFLDKWILFGMLTPEDGPNVSSFSLSQVAVFRPTANSTDAITYIMDFMRMQNDEGGISIIPNPNAFADPSNNCYDCHKSSVLPIHPAFEYSFDKQGKLVKKTEGAGQIPAFLNQLIPTYGPVNFGPHMNVHAYGPPLGPSDKQRSDEFIEKCIKNSGLKKTSYAIVKTAMNCEQCHSSSIIGNINYLIAVPSSRDPLAFENHQNFVASYITKGIMPPGNTLTSTEREALASCLLDEYLNLKETSGEFVNWLKKE